MAELSIRPMRWFVTLAILAALIFGGWWYFSRPVPNPLRTYPTSGRELVRRYFSLIAAGTPADLQKTQALLSWPLRRRFRKQAAAYRQRVGFLDDYLKGLFGANWGAHMRVVANETVGGPASAVQWQYVVAVGTEKFHVRIAVQNHLHRPALRGPPRFGVVAIRELPWAGGARAERAAGVRSLLSFGGMGRSGELLQGISAAYGGAGHEKPWQIKQRLLPIVENPQAGALRQCVYQLWPVRHDPTVRAVLKKITSDPRYAPEIQQVARQVLASHVPKAILVGNGVVNTH